jgi:hypothetical protein
MRKSADLGFRMANLAISKCYRKIDNGIAILSTLSNRQIDFNQNKSEVVLEVLEMGVF